VSERVIGRRFEAAAAATPWRPRGCRRPAAWAMLLVKRRLPPANGRGALDPRV